MIKIFKMLVFMFTAYFVMQICFNFLGTGHEISYKVKNEELTFEIKETYTANQKNESNNYYLEIQLGETIFPLQIYEEMNKAKKIVTKIEYFKNDKYECIMPIFRDDKLVIDVMCLTNGVVKYYHNMPKNNAELNSFITSLAEYKYDVEKFKNNMTAVEDKNYADLYILNLQDKYYAALSNYRGLYTINAEETDPLNSITLYERDVYNREISGYVNNLYVLADYTQVKEFYKFLLVNCKTNGQEEIISNKPISYNSYVQGVHGDSLFIFDRDNQKQYEINTKTKTVIETGNKETGIRYYENGERKMIELTNKEIYFPTTITNDYENDRYYRIDKVGNVNSGYYYLFAKNGNKTDIYRSNVQNKEVVTYIATANQIRDIKYIDDYIYYIDGANINFYSDRSGFRTLLTSNELKFNQTMKYSVFKK